MPEYIVRTLPGETTVRVSRPGGTTRVRTRLTSSTVYVTGGGGGDHNDTTLRDAADAHPISAITGLQDALDAVTGGGGAEVANVSSVLSFDLDGVFAPDDPVAFPPGFILAVVNQNVNPEWDGIYEGQADPSPAPMVRIGGLPETLMWSSYRVTQPSEVVAPLPGGLWAEDDGVWFFVSGRTLADLTDVDVTSDPPAQDDVLAWDDTAEKWTPATLDGGVELGETSTTAYRGDRGKTAYDHSQVTSGNPHGTTAADVGALPGDTVIPDITGLQATSEKNQPNGYAGLDGDGTIPDNRIPSSIARDSEIGTQITAHDGSGTAHPDIRALMVSAVPSFAGLAGGVPIIPATGMGTSAVAPGWLWLHPTTRTIEGIGRLWWEITASSASAGQKFHFVHYDSRSDGQPNSLLWSSELDAATVQAALAVTPSSTISQGGWFGILLPSSTAGNVTFRMHSPVQGGVVSPSAAYLNAGVSFVATGQGGTPPPSLAGYSLGSTPTPSVLGVNHALRTVMPILLVRGAA